MSSEHHSHGVLSVSSGDIPPEILRQMLASGSVTGGGTIRGRSSGHPVRTRQSGGKSNMPLMHQQILEGCIVSPIPTNTDSGESLDPEIELKTIEAFVAEATSLNEFNGGLVGNGTDADGKPVLVPFESKYEEALQSMRSSLQMADDSARRSTLNQSLDRYSTEMRSDLARLSLRANTAGNDGRVDTLRGLRGTLKLVSQSTRGALDKSVKLQVERLAQTGPNPSSAPSSYVSILGSVSRAGDFTNLKDSMGLSMGLQQLQSDFARAEEARNLQYITQLVERQDKKLATQETTIVSQAARIHELESQIATLRSAAESFSNEQSQQSSLTDESPFRITLPDWEGATSVNDRTDRPGSVSSVTTTTQRPSDSADTSSSHADTAAFVDGDGQTTVTDDGKDGRTSETPSYADTASAGGSQDTLKETNSRY